ncbi:MAG TPA: PHP domain-containing protein [Planctomycetota bacterium]|nr:PHP domain-containing protein [Planctomycetota bacterium]
MPLRDFRGIIHCHSKYSHDSQGTYQEILAAAKAAKVDFICMTDHPPSGDKGLPLREGWRGLHDGVLFIQGAEYSDQILGLGLREPISGKDRRGTIQAIHEQGGVAIACHPELIDDWDAYADADGMELYNVHATLTRKLKDKGFLLQVAKVMKEDPEHSFQLLQELDPAILKRYDEICAKRVFAGIAGNDAHQNVKPFGLQVDPYPRAFKFVATHVLAEDLSEAAVLAALKAGRCYVQFAEEDAELLGRGTLEWIGTTVAPGSWLVEPQFTPSAGFGPLSARLLRDGQPSAPDGTRTTRIMGAGKLLEITEWQLKQPGVYRIEALRENGAPVLLTSSVRIR